MRRNGADVGFPCLPKMARLVYPVAMRLALTLALLAPPLAAQELTAPEASLLPRIIDTLCMDLIPDRNGCETAVLLTSQQDDLTADLVIFTDRREGNDQTVETVMLARSMVFNGWAFGQSPSLEASGNSLRVNSEQTGIGRYGWEQTLTLAWRDGTVTLAGITHAAFDRATLRNMRCDVNLLSGDWEYTFNDGDAEPVGGFGGGPRLAVPAASWFWENDLPEVCAPPMSWMFED